MLNILELAHDSGRTLLEIFAQVPGSFEEYKQMTRAALEENPPTEVQGADYVWIEGCIGQFPEKVILEAVTYGDENGSSERKYYQASLSQGESSQVLFTDVIEIEIIAAIQAKNEMIQLEESIKPENIKMQDFNETVEASVTLQPQTEAMKKRGRRTGRVNIAQKADTRNENNRFYPKEVLKEAVGVVQAQINEFGGILMDSQHRMDAEGNNKADLRETVAVAKQIEFNEQDGTVSLPEIEFVETQAGKDLMALLESGVKLQVSQRAHGTSHTVYDSHTNEAYQQIDFLRITGIDFVPPGTASVKEATFEGANESKKEGGNPSESGKQNGQTAELNLEDRQLLKGINTKIENQQAELEQSQTALDEATRQTKIAHLKQAGNTFLESEVEKLSHFSDEQKQMVRDEIKPENFYDRISDVYNEEAIAQVLKPAVAKEVARVDKIIASTKLEERGFPVSVTSGHANRQEGQTRVEVIHENVPGAELCHKVLNEVNAKIKKTSREGEWIMPDDHEGMLVLEDVMDKFYKANYDILLHENTLAQANIGGRIATIAAMVIPTVWRRTTAFQVVDLEPMTTRILDKKIRVQAQGHNTDTDVVTQYANLDPGESKKIAETSIKYLNFPIPATRQTLRSKITPDAYATAKNTPMQPMIDTVTDISMDIRNRIDMALWWLHIIRGLHQETGQVTDWETLTRESTTNTWASKNKAWIPLTWHKTYDAEGNPLTARFETLYPANGESAAPTGLGTHGIELQTTHTAAVALLYGTDYTIDFQSGKITLTAAGETKRTTGSAANIQAKYTHSKNVSFWSMTPPSGTSLASHLLALRRAVGQRRVAVADRNWEPNFIGFNYDIEDLITHNDRMTYLGGSPADLLNSLNQVVNYAGLMPVKSSALPSGWIPVGEKGAACHGVHTPWSFTPPITNEETGDAYILGHQYSASDVPVNDRLGIVAVLP